MDTVLTIDTLDTGRDHESSRRAPTNRVSANNATEWTSAQERQLANAREVALRNRRERLQTKLQTRLSELNSQLGLSGTQMENMAKAMMEQEETLRTKMNVHLKEISTQLRELKTSLPAPPSRADSQKR